MSYCYYRKRAIFYYRYQALQPAATATATTAAGLQHAATQN
jgi:hypothetical protein